MLKNYELWLDSSITYMYNKFMPILYEFVSYVSLGKEANCHVFNLTYHKNCTVRLLSIHDWAKIVLMALRSCLQRCITSSWWLEIPFEVSRRLLRTATITSNTTSKTYANIGLYSLFKFRRRHLHHYRFVRARCHFYNIFCILANRHISI